jgi:hypothetical protein
MVGCSAERSNSRLMKSERLIPSRAARALTDLLHHASGSGPFPIGCDFENGVVTRFLST